MRGPIKYTNIHLKGVPEGERQRAEKIFKEENGPNLPNLRKKINPNI